MLGGPEEELGEAGAGEPRRIASNRLREAGGIRRREPPGEVARMGGAEARLVPAFRDAPDGIGVVVSHHDPVFGSRVLAAVDVAGIVEAHLLQYAEASEAMSGDDAAHGVRKRAQHLGDQVVGC